MNAEHAAVAGEESGPEVKGELIERGLMDAERSPAAPEAVLLVGGEEEGAAGGAARLGRIGGEGSDAET